MDVNLVFPFLIIFFLSLWISPRPVILKLNDSNFDTMISSYDYILVHFYAPDCIYSRLLQPELAKAAPVLAGFKNSVITATINMNKNPRINSMYKIRAYPTVKLFMHGVPSDDISGPLKSRNADFYVQILKQMVDRDVALYNITSVSHEVSHEIF